MPQLIGTAADQVPVNGYLGPLAYRDDNPAGAVVGTNEPQTLRNKTVIENVVVVSTNTAAVASRTYVLTASLTLTLPSNPTPGDWVKCRNRSNTTTAVIARNAQNIMGLAEDMTVNYVRASFSLVFVDASNGWVVF